MTGFSRTLSLMLVLALAGCAATEIKPAPVANQLPGPGQGAIAQANNVVVEARADAWEWRPEDLTREVTPLLVTVRNNSDRPISIQYSRFQLVTNDGRTLRALPPFDIRGSVTKRVGTLGYPYSGFSVYPGLSPYYTDVTPVADPIGFGFDPLYYDTYYSELVQIQLPTDDMLERALPEGVLDPGGEVTGFLYMQNVGEQTARLEFQYNVIDASTGEQFASIEIPFVTEG